jgi:hypothetical protein
LTVDVHDFVDCSGYFFVLGSFFISCSSLSLSLFIS